ncbi:putative iron-regulated membrane protein [Stenotrophomonas maltophilia]|uniref:PepSY-associated TM helix domain-containing protein n=1 Tax=Stenotrophomonas chelatiphaga TaxID=517011 RepID=UPI000F4B44FB|nr:PepSY domain-containing protein [Stenotrophomonas chelatiphaga]MCS4232212.1 putative iron-regulated membrane protein [Stenotrophomonas chelatiphaga]ROQ42257.1 putative iron-regulated membrane protein [Stenotrophomonas maltophilia]
MQTTPTQSPSDRWRFHRAVWRWHFYAGLFVLPFIAWLALTGAAYLYQKPIDRWIHHDLKVVEPTRGTPASASAQIAAVEAVAAGRTFRYTLPERADASVEIGVQQPDGARDVYYVDPGTARVLGSLPDKGTFSGVVRRLHSLDLVGRWASALIEIAAGWAILLVVTGVFLWWPRGQSGGVTRVRGRPAQRLFWRDLHAVTGVWVGAVLLFLALTGMPWSLVWGKQVNAWANGHNSGYPAGVRVDVPMSDQRLADATAPSWSMEQARLPASQLAHARAHARHAAPPQQQAHEGHESHAGMGPGDLSPQPGAIGIDAALQRFNALGMAPGYSVSLPRGPMGVYSASVYPEQVNRQRVVHMDQYSGRILLDMGYADYGVLGRGLEWGINVHLGQQYGSVNRLLLLVACAAIVLLCASGAVMWWKRRPAGGVGIPPLPHARRTVAIVFALLCIGGIVFPLMGLSLLVTGVLDYVLTRGWRSS